jgi:uncharacterized membrane protein (DUF485 family)
MQILKSLSSFILFVCYPVVTTFKPQYMAAVCSQQFVAIYQAWW